MDLCTLDHGWPLLIKGPVASCCRKAFGAVSTHISAQGPCVFLKCPHISAKEPCITSSKLESPLLPSKKETHWARYQRPTKLVSTVLELFVCANVCIHQFIYLCTYASMYLCTYVYLSIYISMHQRAYLCIYVFIYTYIHFVHTPLPFCWAASTMLQLPGTIMMHAPWTIGPHTQRSLERHVHFLAPSTYMQMSGHFWKWDLSL